MTNGPGPVGPMGKGPNGERPQQRAGMPLGAQQTEYTGRYVVLLDQQEPDRGMEALRSSVGISSVERVRGAEPGAAELLGRADVSVVFDELGVAVVDVQPDQRHALVTTAEAEPTIVATEPERVVYASVITEPQRTLTGFFPTYRSDDDEVSRHTRAELATSLGPAWDEQNTTWGLQGIRANWSHLTGSGVKVAVLDTGVDTDHPDLTGCVEATASFVSGASVEDGHGHGTHCVGTVAGPAKPGHAPRYGVAGEARVLVGKVLSDQGVGSDGGILAGMAWAVAQGARVVSMSLGAPVEPGELFPQTYENVARRALRRGTVIVAAAGNESRRPGFVAPVGRPANCPSILAVAALGKDLGTAFFSCGAINGAGGEVNIAAPGVDIFSAAPDGTYQTMSGTSMATPHAAGVATLLAQAHPDASAADLSTRLLSGAHPLAQPGADIGAGLLQAP
ncbi:S8 family serine peptidase [Streptomyces sp. DSM 41524]|uniref:S8 family serine peptidase n=2 Tax=Streptomyces violaceusniger group TaxID=2839105 RepID=A0ABU7PTC0_9ACTN|nr:S8 family serine peptidase [Streptomyces sp. DASNCL29]MEE4592332.1 S8 family serine peptidase [Streptomyces sp. DSM 41524]TMU94726.1 protease [Streptomyces sp. DASNCL29]